MLARTLHAFWLLFAAVLFLFAVAQTAGRLWVPALSGYHHDVELMATEALGMPVSIGRIEGTWRGLSPVLKLIDVAVTDPEQHDRLLAVDEIWVGIDIKNYLRHRQFRLASLDVMGADVTIIRGPDGRLYIDRLTAAGDSDAAIAMLLAGQRLSLHDSVINFHDRQAGRAPWRFSDVTFTMEHAGNRHTLSGYAMLPAQLGYRVDVTAELTGLAQRLDNWDGRFYLHGQALALTPENLGNTMPGNEFSGIADVRCWVDMEDMRLLSMRGELDVTGFKALSSAAGEVAGQTIDRLSAQFGWRRNESGWQAATRNVVIAQGENIREETGFSLAQRHHEGEDYLRGEFSRLFLQDLQPLITLVPGIAEQHRQRLVQLRPEGLIEALSVDIRTTPGAVKVLAIDATFQGLGINPPEGFPAVRGLRGSITGSSDAGALWLKSKYITFRHDRLFREVLQFEDFNGEAAWQYRDGQLGIKTGAVEIANQDFSLTTHLALEVPAEGVSPQIDLQIDVHRGDVGKVRHYLPAGIMKPRGVAWLDRSLIGGEITHGRVVVQGPLDRLPYDHGEGRLEVTLPLSNAVLAYHPQWTRIEAMDAEVNFTGRRMDVYGEGGKISSTSLTGVHARIEDLARPDLMLKGTVQGQMPVMLEELDSSPLGEQYGAFLERLTTRGEAQLGLDLFVPLHKRENETPREIDVKGRILLQGNAVEVRGEGYVLERIHGELAFDTQDFSGKGLQARLLGKPVRVDVWTEQSEDRTYISMRGPVGLLDLARREQPELAAWVTGNSDWEVLLGIGRLEGRDTPPETNIEFSSSLEGVVVNLPGSFGKPRDSAVPLRVKVTRLAYPDRRLRFSYGDIMAGEFALLMQGAAPQIQRGTISLGGKPTELPDDRVVTITGALDQLSVSRWQQVLGGLQGGTGPQVRVALEIGELEVLQHLLRDVTLQAETAGVVQDIRLAGPSVKGEIQFTRTAAGIEKVVMTLDKLVLESEKADPVAPVDNTTADPEVFPDLQITVHNLVYNGIPLGQLELQTTRNNGRVQVDRLAVASKMLQLRATGEWKMLHGESISHFQAEVSEGRLDRLLKAFDYQEEVDGGDITGSLQASWRGAPWTFRPDKVEGKLYLLIQDGRLLNVKPGAGRVFGLVSLHTLQRRLSLDFDDLVKEGFAFDRIEGHFTLDGGDAYTNDLFIKGPAARIEISGRIGLADQDYDELVTVIPSMRSGLPLAGLIAGGPAVGAVLLFAEQLFGDQLEDATRFARKQYTVTGPWSDPVYQRLESKPEESDEVAVELSEDDG